MTKRKREEVSPDNAIAGPSTTPSHTSPTAKHRKKQQKKQRKEESGKSADRQTGAPSTGHASGEVTITWELADGSRRYQKRISSHKSMDHVIAKVRKHLGISLLGGIRLAEVRAAGRESEIFDEYDFKALVQRAIAFNGSLVKVYSTLSPFPTTPTASTSSTPSHLKTQEPSAATSRSPNAYGASPAIDHSAKGNQKGSDGSSTPDSFHHPLSPSIVSPSSKPKKKKKVSISLLEDTPSAPGPSTPQPTVVSPSEVVQPSMSISTSSSGSPRTDTTDKQAKGRGNKKRNRKRSDGNLANPGSAPPLEPPKATNLLLSKLDRYKPARPSPLSRPVDSDHEVQDDKSDTVQTPRSANRKKRRRRTLDPGSPITDNSPTALTQTVPDQDITTAPSSPRSPPSKLPAQLDSSIVSTPKPVTARHSTPVHISLSTTWTPIEKLGESSTPRESSSIESPTKTKASSSKNKRKAKRESQITASSALPTEDDDLNDQVNQEQVEDDIEEFEEPGEQRTSKKSKKDRKEKTFESALETVAIDDEAMPTRQATSSDLSVDSSKKKKGAKAKVAVPPSEPTVEITSEPEPTSAEATDSPLESTADQVPPVLSSIDQIESSTAPEILIEESPSEVIASITESVPRSSSPAAPTKRSRSSKRSEDVIKSVSRSIMEEFRAKKAAQEAAKANDQVTTAVSPLKAATDGTAPEAVIDAGPLLEAESETSIAMPAERQQQDSGTDQAAEVDLEHIAEDAVAAQTDAPTVVPEVPSTIEQPVPPNGHDMSDDTTVESPEEPSEIEEAAVADSIAQPLPDPANTTTSSTTTSNSAAEVARLLRPMSPSSSNTSLPARSYIPAKGNNRKTATEEYYLMAHRVPCIICLEVPSHLQKHCPTVNAGLEALQETLLVRQKQAAEEAILIEARKKDRRSRRRARRNDDEQEDDEPAFMAAASVEAIQNWIERQTKIRRRITGEEDSNRKIGPQPDGTFISEIPGYSSLAETVAAGQNLGQDPLAQKQDVSHPEATPSSPRKATRSTLAALIDGDKQASLADAQTTEAAPALHLLHQRALARPRRPGSLSGLSASDAVIETNPSDSESDSDSNSGSGSEDGSGSESESGSSTGTDLDEPGQHEKDLNTGNGRSRSRSPVKKQFAQEISSQQSESGGSQTDAESETSSTSSTRSIPDDPEASFRHYLSKPLSRDERRRARISAASMRDSQIIESDPSDVDADGLDDEDEEEANLRPTRPRAGSESSIGDFGGDDGIDGISDEQSDIQHDTLSQSIPPVLDGSPSTSTKDTEASRRSSRSFVAFNMAVGNSPPVDDLEGSKAIREAIEEDRGPEVLIDETMDDGRGSHINEQGLPSPPSSHDEEIIATQLADTTPTPRKAKQAVQIHLEPAAAIGTSQVIPSSQASLPSRRETRSRTASGQSPAPSQRELPNGHSPNDMRRRLRSVSRDIQLEQTPRRSSRITASQEPTSPRITRSQVSQPNSPEISQNRRSQRGSEKGSSGNTGLQMDIAEISQDKTPVQSTQRRTRRSSSQFDELESSQPVLTGVAASVSDAEESNSTIRRSSRTRNSPLFMTQGSQALATQRYTTLDSSLPPGTQVPRTDGKNANRQTSPIVEESEDEVEEVEESNLDEDDHPSNASSEDDDDNAIPILRPIHRRALSQQPVHPMPTLSSLDTSLLRAGRSVNHSHPNTASQPAQKSKTMLGHSDSEGSSDSSSDEEIPIERKGRYASGRSGRGRPKTNGVMRGW